MTIDADTLKWEKAIEEDSTQYFIHVRGVNDRNVPDKQVRALKIKSIPRNFLLDKERRIIAKRFKRRGTAECFGTTDKITYTAMRHTLFLILIWMPLLICATDKNVNITIKLSTELSQTEQWIYASGYVGANEYAILDSVKVNKGDTQTKLSFDIYEGMSIYILCAEKGPVNLFFHIEPNTNCEIEIDENMDGRYPRPMKGNDMQNELLAFDNKILYIGKKERRPIPARRQHTIL